MPGTTRYETVTADDGGKFEAYCAVPEGAGSWPGVVLFQEIFGINDNMRGLAEKMAGAGYVAVVPDMFWRLEPRFERKDESGDPFIPTDQIDEVEGALAGPDVEFHRYDAGHAFSNWDSVLLVSPLLRHVTLRFGLARTRARGSSPGRRCACRPCWRTWPDPLVR